MMPPATLNLNSFFNICTNAMDFQDFVRYLSEKVLVLSAEVH